MNKNWAMLAVDIDTLDPRFDIGWPAICQPKLDGVRACWDGHQLFSRQGKLFKEAALPSLYTKLRSWSNSHPDIILDGELYSYEIPFQEICARVAINRTSPHPDAESIDFHAFDIISQEPAEKRLLTLSRIYSPFVAVSSLASPDEIDSTTNKVYQAGFEGLMIRQKGCPYMPTRTAALVKVKPWRYALATIIGFNQGQGKYKDTLGSIVFRLNNVTFNASGGLLDETRDDIWKRRQHFFGRVFTIKYRELSNSGKPLKPQIVWNH